MLILYGLVLALIALEVSVLAVVHLRVEEFPNAHRLVFAIAPASAVLLGLAFWDWAYFEMMVPTTLSSTMIDGMLLRERRFSSHHTFYLSALACILAIALYMLRSLRLEEGVLTDQTRILHEHVEAAKEAERKRLPALNPLKPGEAKAALAESKLVP